jgi:hypothetical protein
VGFSYKKVGVTATKILSAYTDLKQLNSRQSNHLLHIKVKLDDTATKIQFGNSACTCKSCNHRIALDCIDANCGCCRKSDHSMVLDGIEGFSSQRDT